MGMLELILILTAAGGVLAAVICTRIYRRKIRQLEILGQQIEHFLLYQEEPLSECLEEGGIANLHNQAARLEQQLLHQRALSRRSEEQMTRFVENMAHQMKNAVTALQIQLDLLGTRLPAQEQVSLQKSQACLERLTREIDRILKSSQLAAGKIPMEWEPLELSQMLDGCAERSRALAESKHVEIRIEKPEKLYFSGDGFWLSQALDNLLKNALEHTADSSSVTVRLTKSVRSVEVLIEDEGPGIPAKELPELFKRFHRGVAAKAGYGIGLSMALDIVRAHHGDIAADNRVGGGAMFRVTLPVLDGAGARL